MTRGRLTERDATISKNPAPPQKMHQQFIHFPFHFNFMNTYLCMEEGGGERGKGENFKSEIMSKTLLQITFRPNLKICIHNQLSSGAGGRGGLKSFFLKIRPLKLLRIQLMQDNFIPYYGYCHIHISLH